jgi:hypothetical protein
MSSFARKCTAWIALLVLACLVIVLAAPSPVVPASACPLGTDEPCRATDISLVPQALVDEADDIAESLFGNDSAKCDDFSSQLLGMYLLAEDTDVLIINNSGGWGWSSIVDAPHGTGVIEGINTELSGLGYDVLWLDYYRTPKTIGGSLSELIFAFGLYPSKPQDLATRVDFLSRHLPDIEIILNGESNGCTLCSEAMHLLEGNAQVFSIELGPPPLNHSATSDQSLILRTNGFVPDFFSQGDLVTIFRTNVETLLGISPEYPGSILLYVGAPGHDYAWEYPGVGPVIAGFLESRLGENR